MMTKAADSRAVKPRLATALLGGLLAAAVLAGPALAARTVPSVPAKPAKKHFSMDTPIPSFDVKLSGEPAFSFTASGAAPVTRTAALERAFRFTPSGQADNRKALSLGVATRMVAPVADHSRAAPVQDLVVVPNAYNVDLSLAWRGFAVNGGFAHVERPPQVPALGGPLRDAVNLGFSYGGAKWRTKLQGTAEQGNMLALSPLQRRYSLELGGSYLLSPRFSVTGGVRYRLAPEHPSLFDPDRDDRSVYLGTAIAF
jgi:hypothetical protein